jgi:hypothetical protein
VVLRRTRNIVYVRHAKVGGSIPPAGTLFLLIFANLYDFASAIETARGDLSKSGIQVVCMLYCMSTLLLLTWQMCLFVSDDINMTDHLLSAPMTTKLRNGEKDLAHVSGQVYYEMPSSVQIHQ